MNELKYLGKLAPDIAWDRGNFRCLRCCHASRNQIFACDCRREHSEGALKEVKELMQSIYEGERWRDLNESIRKEFIEYDWLDLKTKGYIKEEYDFGRAWDKNEYAERDGFVAFLISKTIGGVNET